MKPLEGHGTLYNFSSLVYSLRLKNKLFKNVFDLTTAGEWGCVAAVKRSLSFLGVFFASEG